MLRLLAVPSLAFLSACHLSLHGVTVDGVHLPAKHEEMLTLESWPANGFTIESHQGDINVTHGEGPITITAMVLEREPGEAHVHVEDGRLVARAPNGATCALGRVSVRSNGPIPGLELASGMGDLRVGEVDVTGHLKLSTGMGDVDVRAAGSPDTIDVASGKGDISVTDTRCARFSADTGMGDVRVTGLEASEQAELASGLGDVDIERSKGARVKASTGLGNVDIAESSFAQRDLDSGLGRVREH